MTHQPAEGEQHKQKDGPLFDNSSLDCHLNHDADKNAE